MKTAAKTPLQKARDAYRSRMEDFRCFLKQGSESDEEQKSLHEYGLSLEWEEPEGEAGYVSYVLSTGGPHVEFRFYVTPTGNLYNVKFIYVWNPHFIKVKPKDKDWDTLAAIYYELMGDSPHATLRYLIDKAQR